MNPSAMRRVICKILLVRPDPNNWSEYPNISQEVAWLMEGAPWNKVYDIAEALYAELAANSARDFRAAKEFERRLNDFLVENGIGWELREGQITRKGSESFRQEYPRSP